MAASQPKKSNVPGPWTHDPRTQAFTETACSVVRSARAASTASRSPLCLVSSSSRSWLRVVRWCVGVRPTPPQGSCHDNATEGATLPDMARTRIPTRSTKIGCSGLGRRLAATKHGRVGGLRRTAWAHRAENGAVSGDHGRRRAVPGDAATSSWSSSRGWRGPARGSPPGGGSPQPGGRGSCGVRGVRGSCDSCGS